MTGGTSPQPEEPSGPFRRIKLTMNTSPPSTQERGSMSPKEASSSPLRPSYSPVTPTLAHAPIPEPEPSSGQWMIEPDPLPISLDENPDAIALKATMSLLQMQRQQSLRDIRSLDRLKHEALSDPEDFIKDLQAGKLSQEATMGIDVNDTDGSEDDGQTADHHRAKFPRLPTAQNIARCPPIEWAKYRVQGRPLEQLHNVQKQYPGLTEETLAGRSDPQQHEIVAPYRPFTDSLDKQHVKHEERMSER